jgi:hypothetical protein
VSASRWRDLGAVVLGLLGLSQMAGDLFGVRTLKGIGAASAMAPCPKVFCDVNGLEGFTSTFILRLTGRDGCLHEIEITPQLYARLKGPYNRRNAYGAAISFAPKLPSNLWQSVYDYAWRKGGPLRTELDVPDDTENVSTFVRTGTRGRHDTWELRTRDLR